MKNFYEATVTKRNLDLDIVILLKPVGTCYCLVKINHAQLFDGFLSDDLVITDKVPLTDSIEFNISVERAHPEAIIIEKITIDGYDIMPIYLHLADPPTNYLDHSGSWALSIPNFYPWYHEITGQGWIA